MIATYAIGGAGLAIGISTVNRSPGDLTLSCLLSVGAVGILSFVRHALLNRSDAARMGWDYGRRNNFQVEVGLANLAWGLAAVLAVAFGWGLAAEAALFLTVGIYMSSVELMNLISPGGKRRGIRSMIATTLFAAMLLYIGIVGITSAT